MRIDAEPRLELARERRAELVPGREHREAGEPDRRAIPSACAARPGWNVRGAKERALPTPTTTSPVARSVPIMRFLP